MSAAGSNPSGGSSSASGGNAFTFECLLRDQGNDVDHVQAVVAEALEKHGYNDKSRWAIRLALEEAIVNGFRHGNKSDPSKAVHFGCRIGDAESLFDVRDEGPGFDPDTVPDPTEDENIEIPSGRGIMLIKAYMTDVFYFKPGNHLRMIYRKS
ncbi:MAG: ATP-binding protein [Phycisphaerae bacterium]|jgi:serine/threonine-protein kinase RsbW|nr:ATP-binding protein [Phycisphaerae bacterium]